MLGKLTARQLAEWEAYTRIDPIGEERSDFRVSYMASLLTNLVIRTMGKQGAKLTSVSDFLFKWDEGVQPKQEQTIEQMKAAFASIASSSKKKETKRRKPPKRLRK